MTEIQVADTIELYGEIYLENVLPVQFTSNKEIVKMR